MTRLPMSPARRARRAAARRAMHALQLRRRIAEQIEVRDAMPFRCARRELAKLRLFALACRADAWEALAAGNAALARQHLGEARRYAASAGRGGAAADAGWAAG